MSSRSSSAVSGSRTYAPAKTSCAPVSSPMPGNGPMTTTSAMSSASPPTANTTSKRSRPGRYMSTITRIRASSATPAGGRRARIVLASMLIIGGLADRQRGGHESGQEVGHRQLPELEQQAREDAEADRQDNERCERNDLGPVHVGQVVADALEEVGQVAKDDALVHEEQVCGAEHHRERRDRRHPRVVVERAHDRHELADEAGEAGQAKRAQHEE